MENPTQRPSDDEQAPDAVAKPKKIVREEIKDRHTSHWDMDMLSREELEALMTQKPASKPD